MLRVLISSDEDLRANPIGDGGSIFIACNLWSCYRPRRDSGCLRIVNGRNSPAEEPARSCWKRLQVGPGGGRVTRAGSASELRGKLCVVQSARNCVKNVFAGSHFRLTDAES